MDAVTRPARAIFFVADYTNAYASPDQIERIRELDPPIQDGVLPTHAAWLGSAIQRYGRTDCE